MDNFKRIMDAIIAILIKYEICTDPENDEFETLFEIDGEQFRITYMPEFESWMLRKDAIGGDYIQVRCGIENYWRAALMFDKWIEIIK